MTAPREVAECPLVTGTWEQLTGRYGGRFRELCRAQGIDSPSEPWNTQRPGVAGVGVLGR